MSLQAEGSFIRGTLIEESLAHEPASRRIMSQRLLDERAADKRALRLQRHILRKGLPGESASLQGRILTKAGRTISPDFIRVLESIGAPWARDTPEKFDKKSRGAFTSYTQCTQVDPSHAVEASK